MKDLLHSISYSSYADFMYGCHRRWYWNKVIRPVTQDPPEFIFGKFGHGLIEAKLVGKLGPEPDFLTYLPSAIDRSTEAARGRDLTEKAVGFLKEGGYATLWVEGRAVATGKKDLASDRYGNIRILDPQLGVYLSGRIDYIGEKAEEIFLIDWKTSTWEYNQLQTETSVQLAYYQILTDLLGIRVDHFGYGVMNKVSGRFSYWEAARFDDTIIEDLRASLAEMIEMVRSEKFNKLPGTQCPTCSFIRMCWPRFVEKVEAEAEFS